MPQGEHTSDPEVVLKRRETWMKAHGYVYAEEFFKFYVARKAELRDEFLKEKTGAQSNNLHGWFELGRWAEYCGLTKTEIEALERRVRDWKRGQALVVKEEIAEKVLTNLGRPDLYAVWFLDDVVQRDAA